MTRDLSEGNGCDWQDRVHRVEGREENAGTETIQHMVVKYPTKG